VLLEKELKRSKLFFYRIGSLLFLAIFCSGIFFAGRYLHEIISILGYSVLISYLLIGPVDWIQTKTFFKNRSLITLFIFLLVSLFFIIFGTFIVPSLIRELQLLSEQIPSYFKKLESLIIFYKSRIKDLNFIFFDFLDFDFGVISKELSSTLNSFSQKVLKNFVSLAFNTINFAVYSLSTIFISAYFIIDGPKLWHLITRPLSPQYLKHFEVVRHDLSRCLKGFFIGQVQLSTISGVLVFIMYLLMGSKYALLLGIFQLVIEIIPVVGGFVGILSGVIVLSFSSPIKALIAFLTYIFYTQVIKDNFLTPRVMSNVIGLHPVFIIISVLVGSKIGGLSGVIFALPVASLISIVFSYYLEQREYQNLHSDNLEQSQKNDFRQLNFLKKQEDKSPN